MQKIEEMLKRCRKCQKTTIHQRNVNQMGWFLILVNIVLCAATLGVWIFVLAVWFLLNKKIGGWHCSSCS